MMQDRPSFVKSTVLLWSKHPYLYAAVAILPYIVVLGLIIAVGRTLNHFVFRPDIAQEHDPLLLWRSMSWGERLAIIFAMFASAAVPGYLAARGICRMVLDDLKGANTSVQALLADMVKFFPTALLYFVVLGVPTLLGSFFCVVPGLLVSAAFGLVVPASIEVGGLRGIRRGLSLVGRVYGKALGAYVSYFALLVVGRILTSTVAMAFPAAAPGEESRVLYVMFIPLGLWLLAVLLANAPLHIVLTLLYCQSRDTQTQLAYSAASGPATTS